MCDTGDEAAILV